jgi:UDP-N-acetylmuramoyl-tripeptide--D-alanyl-D-alanine ligase
MSMLRHTYSASELQQSLGGRLVCDGGSPPQFARVVIDSRQVQSGDLFWALPGRQQDGAEFVGDAYVRGAAGVVSSRAMIPAPGRFGLVVPNTVEALSKWATRRRNEFTGPLVAVTGSVGKTTTRRLIETVLGSAGAGSATSGNQNNQLGVPLSLCNLHPDSAWAVFELGASAAGEIKSLAQKCRPQIGVLTAIGEAHLAGFGDLEGVTAAKLELTSALPADGWLIANGDQPLLSRSVRWPRERTIWVGRSAECDLVGLDVTTENGRLSWTVDGREFELPVWGRHHLVPALCALAVGRLHGLTMSEMAESLRAYQPVAMRCEVSQQDGIYLINDTYNANPASLRAALELLRDFDTRGRRICVCGDMGDLGDTAAVWHRTLGAEVVTRCGADRLVALGQFATEVAQGALHAGMPPDSIDVCQQFDTLATRLMDELKPGDVVLFKAARSVGMERLVSLVQAGLTSELATT